MSTEEVVDIVKTVTGIDVTTAGNTDPEAFARYIAIVMMDEEGYSKIQISAAIGIGRPHVYTILDRTKDLLRFNRTFKNTYLACIARMAELEDNA
jgi:hypothetical protein